MLPVHICIKLRPTTQMDLTESTITDDAAASPFAKTPKCQTRIIPDPRPTSKVTSNTEEPVDVLSSRPSPETEELNPPLNLSGGLRGVRRSSLLHSGTSLQPETKLWKPYIRRVPTAAPFSASYKRARPNPETYIKIVEQPASNASRFRYECEGRTAGSMIGVSSTPDRKTFPAVKLVGYEGRGKPYVVVSCVTKDYPYKPHPHNLVGTDCTYGVCRTAIEIGNTKTFSNLGIQCVKKRDFEQALLLRERYKIDPFKSGGDIRSLLDTTVALDYFSCEQLAWDTSTPDAGFNHKSDRSTIDLNAVRLCFQAFVELQAITPPVASDVIYDKKFSGVLHICKLSKCSASVEGGEEVILLCRKISKDDIKVYLYEMQNERVVWQAEAKLTPELIHEQSAIPFLTPEYKDITISNPVQVYIQLFRPSDSAVSEPKPFQLLPIKSPDLKLNLEKSQNKPKTRELPISAEQIDDQPLTKSLHEVSSNTNHQLNALLTNRYYENVPLTHRKGQLETMPHIDRKTQSLVQANLQPERIPHATQPSRAVSHAIRQTDNFQHKHKFLNLPQTKRQAESQLHHNPQPDCIPHSNQQYCIVSYARPPDALPNANPLLFNLPNTTWQTEPSLHCETHPGVNEPLNQKVHTLSFAARHSEALCHAHPHHWTVHHNMTSQNAQPEHLSQPHSRSEHMPNIEEHAQVLCNANPRGEPMPYTNPERRSFPNANQHRWAMPYVFRHSERLPYEEKHVAVHLHPNEQHLSLMHNSPQPEDLSYGNLQPRDLTYESQQPDDRLHIKHERTWTLLPGDQHPGPPPAHSQSGAMSYALLEANHQRWALPYASRQCGDLVRINEDYLAQVQDDRHCRRMPHFSQQPRHEIQQRSWALPYVIGRSRSPPQGNT